MGGRPSKPVKQWADRPFPLIESPLKKLGKEIPTNLKTSGAFMGANEMTLVHNCLIRALNCIYLQAPNVKEPADVADLLTFMKAWSLFLHMHHETEEVVCFPEIEKSIGIPGFMAQNVEQHAAFGPGVGEYDAYVKACQEGKDTFDGERVRKIIDRFGAILTQHLTEEIDTLLSLEEHNDKIDWADFNKKVQKKAVDEGDPILEVPCILTNMELYAEDGIHRATWPPMPWFVLVMFRWRYIPLHKGAWRFSSCDQYGYPKELPFV